MIKSMTGYGKAIEIFDGKKICCELKSLNSKQMDIALKLPSNYREYELDLRNHISKALVRGKVEVNITVEDDADKSKININSNIVQAHYEQIKAIAAQMNIPEPDANSWFKILLTMPDVFQNETVDIEKNDYVQLLEVVDKSLAEFDGFRRNEGNILKCFFEERIDKLQLLASKIDLYEKERIQKIRERIEEDLNQIRARVEIDKNRFEQEMIFYIEKLDVSEEKSRLRCHLEYFLQTLDSGENQGKKLGFIAQEIGREVNTLGSKSNHTEMQKIVVMMKDELEQIKEQVLNVL